MLAAVLLAAALAIVGFGMWTGGGFAARFARSAADASRRRALFGWATGTAITYGLTTLAALALLGRVDAVWNMPVELRRAAWRMGLAGGVPPAMLAWFGGCVALGTILGLAILAIQRARGRAPPGLRYRSPAAIRAPGEWPGAMAIAFAAGIAEELFFRLLLPLLLALVLGWSVAAFAMALATFVVLHRHQGAIGMTAVAIVGAGLTFVYLLTGMLWLAMLLHVLIDLNALILRPLVSAPRRA